MLNSPYLKLIDQLFERQFLLSPWVREKRMRNQLRLVLKDSLEAGWVDPLRIKSRRSNCFLDPSGDQQSPKLYMTLINYFQSGETKLEKRLEEENPELF